MCTGAVGGKQKQPHGDVCLADVHPHTFCGTYSTQQINPLQAHITLFWFVLESYFPILVVSVAPYKSGEINGILLKSQICHW